MLERAGTLEFTEPVGQLGLQGLDRPAEAANALLELLRCHRVLGHHRLKTSLVEMDLGVGGGGIEGVELADQLTLRVAQLIQ